MNDTIDRLRAHDPERHGSPAPPPVEGLLALIDADEARAAREQAASAPRPGSATRSPRWVGPLRGGPVADAGLTLPARAVRGAFVAGLAAAVLAATLLVALGGGPAGGPPALAPGGPASLAPIVHARWRAYHELPSGRRAQPTWQIGGKQIGTSDGPVDRWSTAAPLRWREIRRLVPVPGTAMPGGAMEVTYADGFRLRQNTVELGQIRREPINPERWKRHQNTAARELMNGTADPRGAVEELLANGYLQALGHTDRDGRRLLYFVREIQRRRRTTTATRTSYLLDPATWKPVEVETETWRPGEEPGDLEPSSITRWVYEVYETLPQTEENLRLLELGGPTG